MIYERDKEKQALLDALDEEGHLSQSAFKSYVKNMFHNSVNVFSYMTQEEVTFLQSSWPEEYLLNVENDEKTTHWAQSQILCKLPTRRDRSEFIVRGSGFIRLPLMRSITPAGMDVKGGGKAAVHRSAVQRRADP